MGDLRLLLGIAARHKGKLALVALLVAAWQVLTSGAYFEGVAVSPDGTYRLEYYSASIYQRLLNPEMELPSFVRLYRNTDNHYFGESNVADFVGGNGGPFWMIEDFGKVRVGRDIVFEGIPPVGPGGIILDLPPGALQDSDRPPKLVE